ncbi:hypothetical protein BJX76DRAFT_366111 [Aspergillus varians]
MSSSTEPDYARILNLMLEQLDNVSMDPGRRESMRCALQELSSVVASLEPEESSEENGAQHPAERIRELAGAEQKVHELLSRIGPAIRNPTYPGDQNQSRTVQPNPILESIQELKAFVSDVRYMTGREESDKSAELFSRLARLQVRMHSAQSEADVKQLEVEELRQAAEEVRRFARRRNLMLVQPVWSYRGGVTCANALFFSGPDSTREALCTFAQLRGFEVRNKNPIGVDFAEGRWHDLQEANLAVFDLSDEAPQVYYELGIAITLGKELVLLCRRGVNPRFDIGQNYAAYGLEEDRYGVVQAALESCLYRLQNRGDRSTSTVKQTCRYATWLAHQEPQNAALAVLCQTNEAENDPVKIHSSLQLVNQLLTPQHEIILPRWPGSYPNPNEQRCFIVMPFAEHMNTVRDMIEKGVRLAGGDPIRGDVPDDPHILRSIWDEICRANLVVVDLTEFNLNVCLELGIAHTLGRKILLTGYKGTETNLNHTLPNVAKIRLQSYSSYLSLERACFDTVNKMHGQHAVLRDTDLPALIRAIR